MRSSNPLLFIIIAVHQVILSYARKAPHSLGRALASWAASYHSLTLELAAVRTQPGEAQQGRDTAQATIKDSQVSVARRVCVCERAFILSSCPFCCYSLCLELPMRCRC